MGHWACHRGSPSQQGSSRTPLRVHCVGEPRTAVRLVGWAWTEIEGTSGRAIRDGTTQYDTAAQLESNAKKCHTHDGYAVISRRERVSPAAGGPTGRGQPEARIVPGIRQR
jgi:hypothetical protein